MLLALGSEDLKGFRVDQNGPVPIDGGRLREIRLEAQQNPLLLRAFDSIAVLCLRLVREEKYPAISVDVQLPAEIVM